MLYFLDDISRLDADGVCNGITPKIFDDTLNCYDIPPSYNAVSIRLDGNINSNLDWSHAKRIAHENVSKGFKLFWEMDLGLFSRLNAPLNEQTQFLALGLSLKHFRDTLWKEFPDSLGLSLYRGSLDFFSQWAWDESQTSNFKLWLQKHFPNREAFAVEIGLPALAYDCANVHPFVVTSQGRRLLYLFCRDAAIEYIDMLARQLPGELPACILLETHAIQDPVLLAELLSKESYENLHRAVSKGILPPASFVHQLNGFIGSSLDPMNEMESVKWGICLPQMHFCRPSIEAKLRDHFKKLQEHNIPFRIIAEDQLTMEWSGLDYLVIIPEALSPQGRRKVQGFVAAGGSIIEHIA